MSIENDLFLGFVKVHILHHAEKEPVCGMWLQKELARHGYSLSPGTLYPTLHALENAGYLKGKRKLEKGKLRLYYRLTPRGGKMLERARAKVRELAGEVMV
jgi:DNA-binding PadR family transcriptional regulator